MRGQQAQSWHSVHQGNPGDIHIHSMGMYVLLMQGKHCHHAFPVTGGITHRLYGTTISVVLGKTVQQDLTGMSAEFRTVKKGL